MFDIYKSRKKIYLIPVILLWGVVPVLLYVFIKDLFTNGISAGIIMGPLCIIMLAFFGYMFLYMYRIDPYNNIRLLQQQEPELVAKMEEDFEQSKMVCPHIWKGCSFYFFEGSGNFLVAPIGEVRSFSLKKGYSKSIGIHYDCHVTADYGEAEFAVALINEGSKNLLDVAKNIAEESGIALDYNEKTDYNS